MNKCISIHIWCSSKSVSECVRNIIIYHIILFSRCRRSCCCFIWFICVFTFSWLFVFFSVYLVVCSLLVAHSSPSKQSHRENFKLSFEWSSSGETRYGKIMSSLNDTHFEKPWHRAQFSFLLIFVLSSVAVSSIEITTNTVCSYKPVAC